jgi:hypothetical protein
MSGETLELNQQERMVYDHDKGQLQKAGEEHGIVGFEGRLQWGLDPAAMMSIDAKKQSFGDGVEIDGPKPYAEAIAQMLGTTVEKVWPLIHKLHTSGTWSVADRLTSATDPEIKMYIVLAVACKEGRYADPQSYLHDRERVISDLKGFTPDQFDAKKAELLARVTIDEVVTKSMGGNEVKVPIATGDVALPLSMQGYKGCVSVQAGDYFCQTTNISDSLLEARGLIQGFAEKWNGQAVERVPIGTSGSRTVWVEAGEAGKPLIEMSPSVKRIFPGYVLTYKNKDLAVDLVAEALGKE